MNSLDAFHALMFDLNPLMWRCGFQIVLCSISPQSDAAFDFTNSTVRERFFSALLTHTNACSIFSQVRMPVLFFYSCKIFALFGLTIRSDDSQTNSRLADQVSLQRYAVKLKDFRLEFRPEGPDALLQPFVDTVCIVINAVQVHRQPSIN